jgi:hypothetical protein
MGKTRWYPELPAIFSRQRGSVPFSEGGAANAKIDGDVENYARGNANKFSLRAWVLKMQPTQGPLARRRLVVLQKRSADARRFVTGKAEGFHEGAAVVAVNSGLEQKNAGKRGFVNTHGHSRTKKQS